MGDPRPLAERISLDACRDQGFTPGTRDVAGLLELWETHRASDPKGADVVLDALARGDRGVGHRLCRRWDEASGEQRVALVRVLDRLARRVELPELSELLRQALDDPHPRVVRQATRTVGKLDDEHAWSFETSLLRIAAQARLPERRAAVDALGRLGGEPTLRWLRDLECADPELERRRVKAITLVERRRVRSHQSRIVSTAPLPHPVLVRLRCRKGAGSTVLEQVQHWLSDAEIERADGQRVELRWDRGLDSLYRVRSTLDVTLIFPLPPASTLVDRVVSGLLLPQLCSALEAWTEGVVRFRLDFTAGGRRKSTTWKIAQALTKSPSPLVNDSRDVSWAIEVDETRNELVCLPRGADLRFDHRRRDLPASTHPTLAALLAWAGRPRAGDVVWDPFCGSGSELIECAKLQPDLHLWGTDIDDAALDAARLNLEAAGIEEPRFHLRRISALDFTPESEGRGVSLILSNPPMGRRVMVEDRSVRTLLDDFIRHAARMLAPAGRIVLLSPAPDSTARSARRIDLQVTSLPPIDMGGFEATPQVFTKRSSSR